MFWPLSAFSGRKFPDLLGLRLDAGTLGQTRVCACACACAWAGARLRLWARKSKAHKKTALNGRLVYILLISFAICKTSSDVARRRSLLVMPNSLAFTVTPLPGLPRDALKTLLWWLEALDVATLFRLFWMVEVEYAHYGTVPQTPIQAGVQAS